MLKINNKLKLPLIISAFGISGAFLFQYLTYVPEYSSAAPIFTDTPVTITPTTPLAKWDDLQYMQQMTPEACASATEGQSKKLIDNRDTSKSYTVTKLKGSVGCWMTENMDYVTGRMHSDPTYGGYYNSNGARQVCDLSGWQIPTKNQYSNLLTVYNIVSDAKTLTRAPLNFEYGGYCISDSEGVNQQGEYGYYWPLRADGDGAYILNFNSSSAAISNSRDFGYSVRCVAKDTSDVTPVDPSAGGNTGINDPNISVAVPNMITLDISNSVDIATETNKVNTGEFTATVESNNDYTISLNATSEEVNATSLVNYKDGNKVGEIKTIEGNEQPEVGKSGWGIRVCTGLEIESCTGDYLGLPVKGETNSFVDGAKGVNQHMFQIGIGIGSELSSGTYLTSILVTASQK